MLCHYCRLCMEVYLLRTTSHSMTFAKWKGTGNHQNQVNACLNQVHSHIIFLLIYSCSQHTEVTPCIWSTDSISVSFSYWYIAILNLLVLILTPNQLTPYGFNVSSSAYQCACFLFRYYVWSSLVWPSASVWSLSQQTRRGMSIRSRRHQTLPAAKLTGLCHSKSWGMP